MLLPCQFYFVNPRPRNIKRVEVKQGGITATKKARKTKEPEQLQYISDK